MGYATTTWSDQRTAVISPIDGRFPTTNEAKPRGEKPNRLDFMTGSFRMVSRR